MRNDYIYDDGGRHHYFQMKYKKDHANDCAIRAVAIATGTDYQETRKELWEISLENGRLPNSDATWKEFLNRRGFIKEEVFSKTHLGYYPLNEKRVYVASVRVGYQSHLVAIDQGLVRDTWDCRDRNVGMIYRKP